MASKINDIVESKADQSAITDLRDSKTNKQDTEHCFRVIELMHRMLTNISTL